MNEAWQQLGDQFNTILFPTKYGSDFSEDYLNVRGERNVNIVAYVGTGLPRGIDTQVQTLTPPIAPNPFTLSTPSSFSDNTWKYIAKSTGFYQFKVRMTINNVVNPAVLQFGIAGLTITGGVDANWFCTCNRLTLPIVNV